MLKLKIRKKLVEVWTNEKLRRGNEIYKMFIALQSYFHYHKIKKSKYTINCF
jgi:hypothetical protein